MIVPLLLIDLKGTASASVETKDKAIAVSRFLSVNKVVEPHLESIVVMINDFLLKRFLGKLKFVFPEVFKGGLMVLVWYFHFKNWL